MLSKSLPELSERQRYDLERILRDDRYLGAIVALMVVTSLVSPFLTLPIDPEISNFFLFLLAMGIAGFRNANAEWVIWWYKPGVVRMKTPVLLAAVKSLLNDWVATNIVIAYGIAIVVYEFELLVLAFYRHGGLPSIIANAFLVSMLAPASGLAGLLVARNIRIDPEIPSKLPAKINRNLAVSAKSFLLNRYPYLSAYAGFASFSAIATIAPGGFGTDFAGWLQSSLADASMIDVVPVDLRFQLFVSVCCACILFGAIQKLAIRLSAGFQSLAVRMLIHRDSLLEALMETANSRSTRIVLTEQHPHLKNIRGTFAWLLLCYATLFSLVAFCPAPLGLTISNWLQTCLEQAGFPLDIQQHENLRLFLASIVAAYGTIPVAVMSSAFLPIKKPDCLFVSAKGVISPHPENLGQSPLKQWEDLKTVSLINAGKENETVRLCFKSCGTIKLKTAKLEKQKLAELLSTADEYATKCKFDANVIELRAKLTQDSRAGSLADQSKFSSSIFSTKQCGDQFQDGKYRVIRKLASKPLSAVYLARDQANNRVIVKEFVLPTCVKQTEEMDQSFNREFKALSSLKHNSIANVIETFEENTAKYLVIEHIEGTDLRSIVQSRGRRNQQTVLRWAEQIATLMQFLHGQETPILHRDLTPDNLMEDADGNIRLIDFGAAHQFMEGVTGTLIGKQCYIAPEQLRGQPSMQSDVYSFGGTVFFLLTGHDPSALEQCDLESEEVQAPPWLHLLLKRCTQFNSDDRYQSFDEIISLIRQSCGSKARPQISDAGAFTIKLPIPELEHS
jgi:tRNA A-37 threonylcarbamoyl transferase component Bud32